MVITPLTQNFKNVYISMSDVFFTIYFLGEYFLHIEPFLSRGKEEARKMSEVTLQGSRGS